MVSTTQGYLRDAASSQRRGKDAVTAGIARLELARGRAGRDELHSAIKMPVGWPNEQRKELRCHHKRSAPSGRGSQCAPTARRADGAGEGTRRQCGRETTSRVEAQLARIEQLERAAAFRRGSLAGHRGLGTGEYSTRGCTETRGQSLRGSRVLLDPRGQVLRSAASGHPGPVNERPLGVDSGR